MSRLVRIVRFYSRVRYLPLCVSFDTVLVLLFVYFDGFFFSEKWHHMKTECSKDNHFYLNTYTNSKANEIQSVCVCANDRHKERKKKEKNKYGRKSEEKDKIKSIHETRISNDTFSRLIMMSVSLVNKWDVNNSKERITFFSLSAEIRCLSTFNLLHWSIWHTKFRRK